MNVNSGYNFIFDILFLENPGLNASGCFAVCGRGGAAVFAVQAGKIKLVGEAYFLGDLLDGHFGSGAKNVFGFLQFLLQQMVLE